MKNVSKVLLIALIVAISLCCFAQAKPPAGKPTIVVNLGTKEGFDAFKLHNVTISFFNCDSILDNSQNYESFIQFDTDSVVSFNKDSTIIVLYWPVIEESIASLSPFYQGNSYIPIERFSEINVPLYRAKPLYFRFVIKNKMTQKVVLASVAIKI